MGRFIYTKFSLSLSLSLHNLPANFSKFGDVLQYAMRMKFLWNPYKTGLISQWISRWTIWHDGTRPCDYSCHIYYYYGLLKHGAAELQPAEEALPSHDAHRTLASGVPAVHKDLSLLISLSFKVWPRLVARRQKHCSYSAFCFYLVLIVKSLTN